MLFFLQSPVYFTIIPLLLSIIFLYKWFMSTTNSTPIDYRLPSPPRLPIIGNLHQLGVFIHQSLQSLSQQYGKLMLLHFGSVPVLIVSSVDGAREILKTSDLFFANRSKSSIADRILYGKDMAFSPYGEYWKQIRSVSVLHLLNKRMVRSHRRVREEETSLMVETIKGYSSSTVNLSEIFVTLTNDVICRVALGKKYGGNKFRQVLRGFVEVMGAFNVGDYIPWLAWLNNVNGLNARVDKVAKELDQLMECVIEEHVESRRNKAVNINATVREEKEEEEEEDRHDLVDVMLDLRSDDKIGFTPHRDSIKALVLDMFLAGTETIYTVLEWTIAEIIKQPKIMKKLQDEVRGVAKGHQYITEDDLDKLYYLKSVSKEAMRLHLPAPILLPRECIKDVKVMGYNIAAGTRVIVNAWAIQRDPNLWEEAEKFKPERFMGSSIDYKGHDFQLIPFGAGRRSCPGSQFGMALFELTIANLVRNFDFSLPGGVKDEDIDMTEVPGLSVQRKNPLLVVATPHHC